MNTKSDSLPENPEKTMIAIIKRVATGPKLSKSVSSEEALDGMFLGLDGLASLIQAAVSLIGLRAKREPEDVNKSTLRSILDRSKIIEEKVDELVDIADPYNGYARSLPSSPFLALRLAEPVFPAV